MLLVSFNCIDVWLFDVLFCVYFKYFDLGILKYIYIVLILDNVVSSLFLLSKFFVWVFSWFILFVNGVLIFVNVKWVFVSLILVWVFWSCVFMMVSLLGEIMFCLISDFVFLYFIFIVLVLVLVWCSLVLYMFGIILNMGWLCFIVCFLLIKVDWR